MKALSLLIVCALPGVAFSCSCNPPVSRTQTIEDFFCSEYSSSEVYTARVVGATCNCIPTGGDANLQCQDYTLATGSTSIVNVEVVNRIPESACADEATCSRLITSLVGSGKRCKGSIVFDGPNKIRSSVTFQSSSVSKQKIKFCNAESLELLA